VFSVKKGIFALLAAGACLLGVVHAGSALAATPKAVDLTAGLTPRALSACPGLPEDAVRAAVNRFSADLLAASAEKKEGNLMLSPASVHLALAMTANGAEGSTKSAMLNLLAGRGVTLDRLNRANRDWMALLSRTGKKTTLSIADSIWFDRGYRPSRLFLKRNADFYGAAARSLDFRDKNAPGAINAWVKNATRGTIEKIIESIRRDEVMFLVNAVYFKSDWQVPFEKEQTRKEVFHAPGRDVEVEFMHRTGRMSFLSGRGATGVALPYDDDGRFEFFALLPDGNATPREWLARQNRMTLFGDLAGMMTPKAGLVVQLALPKFESRYEDTLEDELASLGMSIAFDPGRADFSGMSERHTRDLFIGTVRHKTFVRVDEKGTEAAAVTSVGMRMTSLPAIDREISFDRPFLYGIMDRKAGIPLFVGIMENPAAK
jgi:serine protease inhibitor